MNLKLRYYQQQALDRFFDYTLNNRGKHPVVVLPTGSGKSLLQTHIVKKMLEYDNTRVLLITHQKELIKQNAEELVSNFDVNIDYGIYSAGIKRRDTRNRIIFAGIQSAYKKAWDLGWFDLILIDECHLLPHKGEGMYRSFLAEMAKINPNVVIGGLTATAYRMTTGLLTEGEGALFDDICYEATIKELIDPGHFKNIDKTQYLSNIISKNAVNKADLSNVHVRGGEYIPKEMQEAFQKDDLVCKAVREIKEYTTNRKKILVFTAGIDHCEEVCKKMNAVGLESRYIHSKQSDEINEKNIQDFKDGKFKHIINVNVLTIGFNEKAIDCIVLLRSTKSPGLYYQMLGRGLRLHPDKKDCLALDFGSNILLHGPIDKIEIRKKKDGTSEIHTAPEKECPECQSLLHLSVMECPDCGYLFPQNDKHEDKASNEDVLSVWKKPEEITVSEVTYNRHRKKNKPDSLRVDYYIGNFEKYSSWVCLEHEGFAKQKAMQWVRTVTDLPINTVSEALDSCKDFDTPSKITVDRNGKFPNIINYIYEEKESLTPPEETYIKEEDIDNEDIESLLF